MDFTRYAGHFHPVLVHLPIGILLAAVLLEILSYKKGFKKLRKAVRILLFVGFAGAFFSALTGYLLSKTGEYDPVLLDRHMWLGISVTFLSFIAVLVVLDRRRQLLWQFRILLLTIGVTLVITGHIGGSLTHGEDYLSLEPDVVAVDETDYSKLEFKHAAIYADLVAPIMDRKCKSCHGPNKQKGKLRLDSPDEILKGGKDGSVLDSTADHGSELLRRISLEMANDKHMPPKDKAQLTSAEFLLLLRWIETGANFKTKFTTFPDADSIIAQLRHPESIAGTTLRIVAMPPDDIVRQLRQEGVIVSFLAQGNGLVSVNMTYADSTKTKEGMAALPKLSDQIAELKINHHIRLNSEDWRSLKALVWLERLSLARSAVQDTDLKNLAGLTHLSSVNFSGTRVTLEGILQLKAIKSIKNIYLFQTQVKHMDGDVLRKAFPGVSIDFGEYSVPTFEADTTTLKKAYRLEEAK